MSKAAVKKIVNRFVKKLDENKFAYVSVYLYGSYAKDTANKFSDIDVAVFTKNLKDWWKEQTQLGHLSLLVDSRIEPKVYDKNELSKPKDPFVMEIMEHGIKVA